MHPISLIVKLSYLIHASCAALEVELSKAPGATVRHVFMDATGAHTLVVLAAGGTVETHYLHAR